MKETVVIVFDDGERPMEAVFGDDFAGIEVGDMVGICSLAVGRRGRFDGH